MHYFFLILDFMFPIVMILLSFYYRNLSKKPPSKVSGMRTAKTTQSQQTWTTAHILASRLLCVWGIILCAFSTLVRFFIPIPQELRSLLNNIIFLSVYIGISVYTNRKA